MLIKCDIVNQNYVYFPRTNVKPASKSNHCAIVASVVSHILPNTLTITRKQITKMNHLWNTFLLYVTFISLA